MSIFDHIWKRGLMHANLRTRNSVHAWPRALKFGTRIFLSLYLYHRNICLNSYLTSEAMPRQGCKTSKCIRSFLQIRSHLVYGCDKTKLFVTGPGITGLIYTKYTCLYYGIYLLFYVCYPKSVSFIEFLMEFCMYDDI